MIIVIGKRGCGFFGLDRTISQVAQKKARRRLERGEVRNSRDIVDEPAVEGLDEADVPRCVRMVHMVASEIGRDRGRTDQVVLFGAERALRFSQLVQEEAV